MPFNYTPLTKEQAKDMRKFPLLERGNYDFVIINAIEKESQAGNPQVVVTLDVYDHNGKIHIVNDYLQLEGKFSWKMRHLCEAVGLAHEYESGIVDDKMLINGSGLVAIKTQVGKQKEDGSFYDDRNAVEDYIAKKEEGKKEKEFIDDNIIF